MACRLLISSLVLVILGNFCESALADGAFIWRKGADLHEPSQKAIILHKDGVQDMVLQVKYSGPAKEFCWLVPVPSTPKLQTVDPDVFAELSLYTQKRMKWGWNAPVLWSSRYERTITFTSWLLPGGVGRSAAEPGADGQQAAKAAGVR